MNRKSYKTDNRPAMQFYIDDWLAEVGLSLCSLEAKGLWIDMLCYMWKSDVRGLLKANGKQIESKELAKLERQSEAKIKQLLNELESKNVFSRLPDGTIYNRRMYAQTLREKQISEIRRQAGKQGGRPPKKQNESKHKSKPISKMKAKKATTSSSPSSSSNNDTNIIKKSPRQPHTLVAKIVSKFFTAREEEFKQMGLTILNLPQTDFIKINKRTKELIQPFKERGYNEDDILLIFEKAIDLFFIDPYWKTLQYPIGAYIKLLPDNLLKAEAEYKIEKELKKEEEWEYKPDPKDPKGSVIRVRKIKKEV